VRAIQQRDRRAALEQAEDDGPRRAARAEHDRARRQLRLGLERARPRLGVSCRRRAVAQHDRVDRADAPHGLVEPVEVLEHRHLVRIETDGYRPERAPAGDRVREPLRRTSNRVDRVEASSVRRVGAGERVTRWSTIPQSAVCCVITTPPRRRFRGRQSYRIDGPAPTIAPTEETAWRREAPAWRS
jgi:hypothetical protein